jgi:hypothetical protein
VPVVLPAAAGEHKGTRARPRRLRRSAGRTPTRSLARAGRASARVARWHALESNTCVARHAAPAPSARVEPGTRRRPLGWSAGRTPTRSLARAGRASARVARWHALESNACVARHAAPALERRVDAATRASGPPAPRGRSRCRTSVGCRWRAIWALGDYCYCGEGPRAV